MRGASLGGLLVGPEPGGAVRRRVALHEELAAPRRAALLQHAVLRRARAHRVPGHRQAGDRVVRAARRAGSARAALLDEIPRFLLSGLLPALVVRRAGSQQRGRPAAPHLVQHALGGAALGDLLAVALAFRLHVAHRACCYEYSHMRRAALGLDGELHGEVALQRQLVHQREKMLLNNNLQVLLDIVQTKFL